MPADDVTKAWAFWYALNTSYTHKIGATLGYSNDQDTPKHMVFKHKKEDFTEILCDRLENVCIENNDAAAVLKSRNVKKAFHYIDTPYPGADQGPLQRLYN